MKKIKILWSTSFLLIISNYVFACYCIGERTVQEEIKYVDAIIAGTILSKQIVWLNDSTLQEISREYSMNNNPGRHSIIVARYQLLVEEIYKGAITEDTITIQTGIGGGDCGIRFLIGEKYIVYAENRSYLSRRNDDFKFPKHIFWTHSCLRTTAYLEEEISEIKKFAKSRVK